MQALHLDYRRGDPSRFRAGLLALGVIFTLVLLLVMYYQNLNEQSQQLDDHLAQVEHALHRGRAAMKAGSDAQQAAAEIKQANETIMQLTLPWGTLFNALESANSSNIALLGIEPNVRKRVVRVSGEAKNPAALFAYIRVLQDNKAMTSVYLTHQQVQERNPEKPVRFTLEASWT